MGLYLGLLVNVVNGLIPLKTCIKVVERCFRERKEMWK